MAAAFLIIVPLLSHFAFSWMGFTPTDEGFTLALSRRIIDGQIPHRDFIAIRPFISPLIHTPEVLYGGNYTFWISRLVVWFELAIIAWSWVAIINRLMELPFSAAEKLCLGLIAFAATAHTKHLTAWFTIDGLFFSSIGLFLVSRSPRKNWKIAGYFVLGLAVLCKQSFLFMAPVALVVLGDWRRITFWVAAAFPGVAYLVFLILTGSFPYAVSQLLAPTGLLPAVVHRYLSVRLLLSLLIGYVLASFIFRSHVSTKARNTVAGISLFVFPIIVMAVSLARGNWMLDSFLVFGLLAALTFYLLWHSKSQLTGERRAASLALLTAWSVSLSGGYCSPALGSGAILVCTTAIARSRLGPRVTRSFVYALAVAAVIVLAGFGFGRSIHIYRERPAAALRSPLPNVLYGGRMIYTNSNTYQFMADLNRAIEQAKANGKDFAILPDIGAYWVTAAQSNRLPAVWPIAGELSTPRLMGRFTTAMESERASTVFIVQKVEADHLAEGFLPLPGNDYYEVARYARTHFRKIGETSFFELYE